MSSIYDLLDSLKIKYVNHLHPPVFTCDQALQIDAPLKGPRTKNLFLVAEKTHNFYLYILECDVKADLKSLAKQLDETRLTFGSEDDLLRLLSLTPGSVSPFGLMHDVDKNVSVILASSLTNHTHLSFHPNVNTATLELSWPDFTKFLYHTGHNPRII